MLQTNGSLSQPEGLSMAFTEAFTDFDKKKVNFIAPQSVR